MFIKQLKYDFKFSHKVFFAMFAGIIALAIILRLANFFPMAGIMAITAMAVAITSYTQILLFFHRNFFGPEGYLMLTLPIKRGLLLLSKFVVSMAWLNFMMLAVPIVVWILSPPDWNFWEFIASALEGGLVANILQMTNTMALALISILFLTVTLANSVVRNKKIHGVIAGIFSAGYHFLFFWIFAQIQRFQIVFVAAFAAITALAIMYLLKKRITLR